MTPFTYTAAVLCGGHSRRMGTDKALLPAPGSRSPLLSHQLATLAALTPPPISRVVAARDAQHLPTVPADVTRLDDDGTAGPLGALVQLLQHATTDHVLVIPVDAPSLTHEILHALLARTTSPTRGVVARSVGGTQPLVALYPRSLLTPFRAALNMGRLSLRRLLAEPAVAAHLDLLDFPDERPFANWNHPGDVETD